MTGPDRANDQRCLHCGNVADAQRKLFAGVCAFVCSTCVGRYCLWLAWAEYGLTRENHLEVKGTRVLHLTNDGTPMIRNKIPVFEPMVQSDPRGCICSNCERDVYDLCDLIVSKNGSICRECVRLYSE